MACAISPGTAHVPDCFFFWIMLPGACVLETRGRPFAVFLLSRISQLAVHICTVVLLCTAELQLCSTLYVVVPSIVN